jgi:hypothetical protein
MYPTPNFSTDLAFFDWGGAVAPLAPLGYATAFDLGMRVEKTLRQTLASLHRYQLSRLYSKSSLTLKEWMFNLSFSWECQCCFWISELLGLVLQLTLWLYSPDPPLASSYSKTSLTLKRRPNWTSIASEPFQNTGIIIVWPGLWTLDEWTSWSDITRFLVTLARQR